MICKNIKLKDGQKVGCWFIFDGEDTFFSLNFRMKANVDDIVYMNEEEIPFRIIEIKRNNEYFSTCCIKRIPNSVDFILNE